MFYGDQVQDTRQLFFSSWEKYRKNQPLLPLEKQIVDVMLAHPEYLHVFETDNNYEQAYFPELGETNPFLHMGLHLAIREQVTTNRPVGIADIYQQLLQKHNDSLLVEHLIIDPLAECLWQAQRMQQAPNEQEYLSACQELLRR